MMTMIFQKISQKRSSVNFPLDMDARSAKRQAGDVGCSEESTTFDSIQEVAGMVTFLDDVDFD